MRTLLIFAFIVALVVGFAFPAGASPINLLDPLKWSVHCTDNGCAPMTPLPAPPCVGGFNSLCFDPVTNNIGWSTPVDIGFAILSQTFPTTPGQRYEVDYSLSVVSPFGSTNPTDPPVRTIVFARFGDHVFLPDNAGTCADVAPPGGGCLWVPLPDHGPLAEPPCPFAFEAFCGLRYRLGGALHESFTDIATGTSTTLEFWVKTASEVGMGGIVAFALPGPSTIVVLGTGMLAVAILLRRRSHAASLM